ncbi:hypothetical protein HYE68_000263 [Fusarium pseudograminearum]|nr:hypothetical protein HYE68_000263 [Fusarium pseudograminearum]
MVPTDALAALIPVKRERSTDLEQAHEALSTKRHANDTIGVVLSPYRFPWRRCKKSGDANRLKIKEKAVVQAEEYCSKIRTALESVLRTPTDSPEAIMMGVRIVED